MEELSSKVDCKPVLVFQRDFRDFPLHLERASEMMYCNVMSSLCFELDVFCLFEAEARALKVEVCIERKGIYS
jgi:hypothetical protein